MISKKVEELFSQDKYLCRSDVSKFIQNSRLEWNEQLDNELKTHNNNYINKKLMDEKTYLDNLYKNVDQHMILDDEQRKAVLSDDDYCLINAGAGSGKSTTIAAKAKYLIDKKGVLPEEICMLSYTRKSAEDLEEKVAALINDKVKVSTFHSLGINILREIYDFPIKVAAESEQKEVIIKYIKENFNNKEKIAKLIQLFPYVPSDRTHFFFSGFISNYNKFATYEEYFEDYKKRKYIKENKRRGGIREYIDYRIDTSLEILNSIKDERCKSIAEVKIANFLFEHGISYTYERIFEERVEENRSYSPDFTIFVDGKKYYIEYFGLSNCYSNGRVISEKLKKYERIRRKKEKFQQLHPEYTFINLDYVLNDEYGNKVFYLETLENELKKIRS